MIVALFAITAALAALFLLAKIWIQVSRGFPLIVDTGFHISYVRLLRDSDQGIPRENRQFLLKTPISYPWGMHWLIARLPARWDRNVFTYGGIVVDILHAGAIGALVAIFLGKSEITSASGALLGAMAASMYLIAPHINRSGARNSSLGPRAFGELLFTISYGLLLLTLQTGSYIFLIPSVMIAALLWATSKFAVQTILFITPLIVVGFFSWQGVMVISAFLVGSFSLSVLLTFGGLLTILRGHYSHSKMYLKVIASSHEAVTSRVGAYRLLVALLTSRPSPQSILRTIEKTFFFAAPVYFPLVGVLGIIWAVDGLSTGSAPGMLYWISGGVVAAVLTNVKALNFLGEPERYLDYVMFPLIFLVVVNLKSENSLVYGVVAFGILWSAAVSVAGLLHLRHSRRRSSSMQSLISDLNGLESGTVLVIPSNLSYALAPWTEHKYLFFYGNLDERYFSAEDFSELFGTSFPLVDGDLGRLKGKYGFDYVVCMGDSIELYKSQLDNIVVNRDDYAVFSVAN